MKLNFFFFIAALSTMNFNNINAQSGTLVFSHDQNGNLTERKIQVLQQGGSRLIRNLEKDSLLAVQNDFKVYPNPASSELTVEGELPGKSKRGRVIFLNTAGQEITSEVYNDNERMIFLIFSLLILLVILIILVAKRNKTREDFSSETKKEALSDQDYKCAICGKFMDHWDRDFDHKNGNRSDNKLSNCRALHPKCHRRMHALGER